MAQRIETMSPEVLRHQLMVERARREELEAKLLALKARLMAGESPDLLVDVASVILEAEQAMSAAPPSGGLNERVSTGKPGSRAPTRAQGPARAWRRFTSTVDAAVNGWTSAKERDWMPEEKDPHETARVWCCRQACSLYQITLPKYARSRKLGWVPHALVCAGDVAGVPCGRELVDR